MPIAKVVSTADGVEVTADDGERVVKAKAAIVTVPFNVLEVGWTR